MKRKMSIPIDRNYNKISNDFEISLFNLYSKDKWIAELTNIDSVTYELMKNNVEKLFFKTGGYIGVLDFDSCYLLSKEILKQQILKSISKNKLCFFESNSNIEKYLRVTQRLTNNVYNLFDKKRRTNIINLETWIIDDIYLNYEIEFIIEDLDKIAITEPSKLISAINLLFHNYEIDTDDVKEICQKYNIDLINIPMLDYSSQFNNLRKISSNNQVVINFEMVAA